MKLVLYGSNHWIAIGLQEPSRDLIFRLANGSMHSFPPFPTDNREESDNDDWEARENSRTHSVKFSEDSNADKETPFVRQNTPHPKELKAKAHKLFSKDKKEEDTIVSAGDSQRFNSDAFEKIPEMVRIAVKRWRSMMLRDIPTTFLSFFSQLPTSNTSELLVEHVAQLPTVATVAHVEHQHDDVS